MYSIICGLTILLYIYVSVIKIQKEKFIKLLNVYLTKMCSDAIPHILLSSLSAKGVKSYL